MCRKSLGAMAILVAACTGSQGPAGPTGPQGPPGPPAVTPGGGVTATVVVSAPANGSFFTTGERPVLTIALTDPGTAISPADVSTAELFVYGPRAPYETVTNVDLLNIPYAPFQASVSLQPLPDGGAPNANWQLNADLTVTYTLNPITIVTTGPTNTGEVPGTYTASVMVLGANPIDQTFALADFQIGTATVESYASGPSDGGTATPETTTCAACHQNDAAGGKMYMAHIAPGFSPVGNYAEDSIPIGTCKSCHNNMGDSPNTLLRKVHGAHRGSHQLAPGVGHPEYSEPADDSLTAFTNVGFPLMPLGGTPGVALTADSAMEKNCTACHVNNVWQTNFSRIACGTCHDNLFFAGALLPDGGVDATATTGVLNPPTNFGQPSAGPCTTDAECSTCPGPNCFPAGAVISLATCDTNASSPTVGSCLLTTHPKLTADFQTDGTSVCAICHAAGTGTFAPVDAVHNITQWQQPITLDGYTFRNVTVTGGSGADGSFNLGDTPVLSFQLFDNEATPQPVPDLITNSAWSGTFFVAGPTSNPQRVYGTSGGGLSMKSASSGTLTYNGGTYTFTPVGGWPANALPPINSGLTPQPAPPGAYTVWFYWARSTNGIRDAVDAQVPVAFATSGPVAGRQVVTQAACASCHGQSADGFPRLALHGDQRKNGETCNVCHAQFAQDDLVGTTTGSCTSNTQCEGWDPANPANSWQECDAGSCLAILDPTPGVEIDFQKLIHNIHFARLREGYAEQNNLGQPWWTPNPIPPGTYNIFSSHGGLTSFQDVLSPVDVRACTNCHADSNAACSSSVPCAFGQTCSSAGTCTNVAWLNPTARACITCHDGADAAAHAALNTYTPTTGAPIESCTVCHAPGAAFAVDQVHNITTLYSTNLAYPRTP